MEGGFGVCKCGGLANRAFPAATLILDCGRAQVGMGQSPRERPPAASDHAVYSIDLLVGGMQALRQEAVRGACPCLA